MTLVEFVPPTPHPLWKLCLQMGITDVIVKVNPSLTGLPDPWRFETLKGIVDRLASAGLKVVGLEGDPFDMAPIKEFGAAGEGRAPARPQALDHYCELLESMGRLGIPLLCYNFMVGTGWARTGVREGRGGAKATYFSLAETPSAPLKLTAEQVWENYAAFITRVLPVAERAGENPGDSAHVKEELGDLLFAVTNYARHLKVDAESALEGTTAKFARRFRAVEAAAKAQGRDLKSMTLAEMDALWEEAKKGES